MIISLILCTVVALLISTYNSWHATFLRENDIGIIVYGGKTHRIISNIPGYCAKKGPDGKWSIVKGNIDQGVTPIGQFLRFLGIYWISWLWPLGRLMVFPSMRVIVEDSIKTLSDKVQRVTIRTDRMPHILPIPVYVKEIETGMPKNTSPNQQVKAIRAEALFTVILRITHPVQPARVFQDRYYHVVSELIAAVMLKAFVNYTITEFFALDKTMGSPTMLQITDEINRDQKTATLGIEIVAIGVAEASVSPADISVWEAYRSVEISQKEGEALHAKATGEAKAIEEIGKAEADAQKRYVDASGPYGGPALIGRAVEKNPKASTLVLGSAGIAISSQQEERDEKNP